MARKGRDFELANKWLYELDKDKYKINSPGYLIDRTTGGKREIDVLLEYYDINGRLRKISIECRDRKNVEDVIWIEQLVQKKEDLELDYIIAITTNTYTKGAIAKAKYHGVIIEKAEMFDRQLVDNITDEFFVDLFFLKFEILMLRFLTKENEIIDFKDLISKLPIHLQWELMQELNTGYYFSIDPHTIMDNNNFDKKLFFEKTENSFITQKNNHFFDKDCPPIINKLKIKGMFCQIKMIPFKVSLPLNKSLSIFEVEEKKNKKFIAVFGSDDENIECGYLNDGKIYNKMKLKDRQYYRFILAEMKINTIFPDLENDMTSVMNELSKKGFGTFDFSKVL